MRCPFCGSAQSSVIDKRSVKSSGDIRRRRKCLKCGKRYTTYERLSEIERFVVKRDGRRQLYDRDKLKSGIEKALEKRPPLVFIDKIILDIESKLWKEEGCEVATSYIGRVVLAELKKIDIIAYLRFASVYRHFDEPGDFTKELEKLTK